MDHEEAECGKVNSPGLGVSAVAASQVMIHQLLG